MKQLAIKSEFLLQSIVRYPRALRCPHCGSPHQALVARKYRVVRIVRCLDCGLYFSRPIYRSWLASNVYDRLYAQGAITALPGRAELAALLASGFRGAEKDASRVLSILRREVVAPRPTLLEIGSSWGYFLHQARAQGFEVAGIEPAARRREFGRVRLGLDLVADWDDLPPNRRYDVVYAAHVLEHFTDLRAVFARIAAHVSATGVVFVEVPNFDPEQFGTRRLGIVGAIHPLGFDSAFFRRNLPRHGLEVDGVFGRWDDVPERPGPVSSGEVIIVRARPRRDGAGRPAARAGG